MPAFLKQMPALLLEMLAFLGEMLAFVFSPLQERLGTCVDQRRAIKVEGRFHQHFGSLLQEGERQTKQWYLWLLNKGGRVLRAEKCGC